MVPKDFGMEEEADRKESESWNFSLKAKNKNGEFNSVSKEPVGQICMQEEAESKRMLGIESWRKSGKYALSLQKMLCHKKNMLCL